MTAHDADEEPDFDDPWCAFRDAGHIVSNLARLFDPATLQSATTKEISLALANFCSLTPAYDTLFMLPDPPDYTMEANFFDLTTLDFDFDHLLFSKKSKGNSGNAKATTCPKLARYPVPSHSHNLHSTDWKDDKKPKKPEAATEPAPSTASSSWGRAHVIGPPLNQPLPKVLSEISREASEGVEEEPDDIVMHPSDGIRLIQANISYNPPTTETAPPPATMVIPRVLVMQSLLSNNWRRTLFICTNCATRGMVSIFLPWSKACWACRKNHCPKCNFSMKEREFTQGLGMPPVLINDNHVTELVLALAGLLSCVIEQRRRMDFTYAMLHCEHDNYHFVCQEFAVHYFHSRSVVQPVDFQHCFENPETIKVTEQLFECMDITEDYARRQLPAVPTPP
ncbi:hypothetical protein B0H17DRAFT_1149153 [Mycena rosella]|uniref:Uncharacterized protein n=1 Tax=Mycena rosella TaxID=1033263 RepID=A0AAD7C696_MYCRO|nr:hypothetical protein B0H17DRAFT_1149153 [Mycena rosella]